MPSYPFQCVRSDFFTYKGINYLVTVDRYSNWPIIDRTTGGADSLINSLRRSFITFGIPDELASDVGPEFTSTMTRAFLKSWGVHPYRTPPWPTTTFADSGTPLSRRPTRHPEIPSQTPTSEAHLA